MTQNKHQKPDYRHSCGWNGLLGLRKNLEPLKQNIHCDVTIIGAGYTGIAAARRVGELSPNSDIVVLEASSIGEGNPGRNSGFLLEVALAHDVDKQNLARMQQCNQLIQQAMRSLRDDIERFKIDCGLFHSGTYRAAASATGSKSLDRYKAFLDAAGLRCDTLDAANLSSRIGTRFYRKGIYSPHCYLAQPAALIRGLAERLPDNARMYENSPALGLERKSNCWLVKTPHGDVLAKKVILANNAFCKALGFGQERLVAMYTYAALTEPLDAFLLAQCGEDEQWGVLPAHRLGSTLRRTADGRLLIRSLYRYEKDCNASDVEPELRSALTRRFPQLANVPFAAVWGGATGFTFNAAPLWGELRPELYISAGCNGGGIVKGTLFGKLLAERTLGHDTVDVSSLFGTARYMPPDPLRKLGFSVIAAVERFRARAEV
ncbi:MAG: FAD-dependent oxidoreductase [Woeseia sp.]|nr:FAD-dependent oxidoreductase [Woeseia sp.]